MPFERMPPALQAEDYVQIIHGDVTLLKLSSEANTNIAFFDPPYQQDDMLIKAITVLKEKLWINGDTLLVIETAKDQQGFKENLIVIDERQYGLAKVTFAKLA